jgi:hypothetical protein
LGAVAAALLTLAVFWRWSARQLEGKVQCVFLSSEK